MPVRLFACRLLRLGNQLVAPVAQISVAVVLRLLLVAVAVSAIAGLLLSYFHEDFVRLCPGWPMTPDFIVIWAAVVCTLCALCFYVWKNVRQAKELGVIGQKKK